MVLHNKRYPKAPLDESEGFDHRKSLGQHFLAAPEILDEIAELLPIKGKRVLEIGAGDGRLTEVLAEQGAKVTALEIDERLIALLDKKFARNKSVKIIQESALEYSFASFKLLFGNLPYKISTPILMKTLESNFEHAVYMLQAEFGERLVAQPGTKNYSRLSVSVQAKANAEIFNFVPRECFYPIPDVDSVLVHITPKEESEVIELDEQLVSALFQHPNQNLKKALKHSRHLLGKERVEKLMETLPQELLAKSAREVSLEEFAEISGLV